MFDNFFNLQENPFGLNPNPKFFFLNKVHSDAMKYLMFGIKNQEGFIEVLGETGTGKTLLCLMLLNNLRDEAKSVFFPKPPDSENELLQKIVNDLNLGSELNSREDMVAAVREFTRQESSQEHNIVFLFDEAQHLSYEMLEKIRLLTNAPDIKRPIHVILVGQPELDKKLCAHSQLQQRITLRFRLQPLTPKEVPEYINFRVTQANPSRNIIFSRGALRLIFQFSNGNPLLVNVVCEKAILAASLNQDLTITHKLIQEVLKSNLDVHKPSSASFAESSQAPSLFIPGDLDSIPLSEELRKQKLLTKQYQKIALGTFGVVVFTALLIGFYKSQPKVPKVSIVSKVSKISKPPESHSVPDIPSSTNRVEPERQKYQQPSSRIASSTQRITLKKNDISSLHSLSLMNTSINKDELVVSVIDYPTSNDTIIIQPHETLGHYAEWTKTTARQLRKLNGIPFRRSIRVGRKIKVDFKKVGRKFFEESRRQYHHNLQINYLKQHTIVRLEKHVIKSKQNVWTICQRIYRIPLWLLRKYNKDKDLTKLTIGEFLHVPIVVKKD